MKKKLTLFFGVLFLSIFCTVPGPGGNFIKSEANKNLPCDTFSTYVYADEILWNNTSLPICDPDDVLDDTLRKEENYALFQEIPELEFDIVSYIISADTLKDYPLDTYLEGIYAQNNRGYGVNKDGIILGVNTTDQTFMIRSAGRGQAIFTEEVVRELSARIRGAYSENGLDGVQQAYHAFAKETVEASSVMYSAEATEYEEEYPMAAAGLADVRPIHQIYADDLPDWYIQGSDLDSFEDFHNDPSEPRLIDRADIFTDEEEAGISQTVQQIRDTYGWDLVIYTDDTSYGIDNELYAEDFYVFNGYGAGDTYDGMVLFVNMDPDNREMVTCARGAVQSIHNRDVATKLDDILYADFTEQAYGQGVINWLEAVEELYHYKGLDLPEWYREKMDGTIPSDASDHRMVDDLNALSQEDADKIESLLKEYSENYGIDCVVYLSGSAYNLDQDDLGQGSLADMDVVDSYSETFYETMGYGNGESKSGVLLTIYVNEVTPQILTVHAYGDAQSLFTEKILSRLTSIPQLNLSEGNYAYNINRYLYYLNKLLKTGHLPHTWPVRIFWIFLCLAAGLITSQIAYSRAEQKMKTVKEETRATDELVPGSLQILAWHDILMNTHYIKVALPKSDSKGHDHSHGSSHSSGHSSYSSHSRSSSGASFSSSRRKF